MKEEVVIYCFEPRLEKVSQFHRKLLKKVLMTEFGSYCFILEHILVCIRYYRFEVPLTNNLRN